MLPCILVYSRRALHRGLIAAFVRARGRVVVELGPAADAWPEFDPADLLLLDTGDRRDFEVIGPLRRRSPDLRVLVLTAGRGDYIVAKANRSGAHGVVNCDDPIDVLETAIATVTAGGLYFSAGVAPRRGELPLLRALTDRELLVLEHACAGVSDDDMANAIGCASATAETHRRNAMRKLGVGDRSELLVVGLRLGIVSHDGIAIGARRRRSSSRRNERGVRAGS